MAILMQVMADENYSDHLDCLVKEEGRKVVQGSWHPREWVGFVALKKIMDFWFKAALSEGCLSWDKRILFALAFVLQSSCAARVGDIS